MMDTRFFGLLHLSDGEKSAMNLSTKTFSEQVSIYINNAIVLSKTLALQGKKFTLLTNNKKLVDSYPLVQQRKNSPDALDILEIPFMTSVPSGIKFYSAHFKFDALRYLASLSNCYSVFCDLDVVCINKFPQCLQHLVEAGIPISYDISDQVIPAYGHDVIIRDLTTIGKIKSEGRWSGGEFLAGTAAFFHSLVMEIDRLYGNYITNVETLHHVGDEAVTSAAIESLRRSGLYIADAGTLGIIGRYWSIRVLHPQKSFDYYKSCFLLHLPSDKKLISDIAEQDFDQLTNFLGLYRRKMRAISMMNLRRLALAVAQSLKLR
jgi:hypothetical protein